MAMKTKELLCKIYDCDNVEDTFIIKILVNAYKDLFNDLDPAPLKNRDLDQNLISYLEECSTDIPLRYKLSLQFVAEESIIDEDKERRTILGLKTYFNFVILSFKREIANTYRTSIIYVICAFLLITLSFYLGGISTTHILIETLVEGLSIGGWVFLWEAIALIVFKNHETRLKCKRYERLDKAKTVFIYR